MKKVIVGFCLGIIFSIILINFLSIQPKKEMINTFTLIDEKIEVRFNKLAVNYSITVYALDLSCIDVYLINISENQNNYSLAWQTSFFIAEKGYYSIIYFFSLSLINCTSLSIRLWANPNWELCCVGIMYYSPSQDVLLDELILKLGKD